MRPTRPAILVVAATALPRLVVLVHERGAVLASFTDKSDDFARTFVAHGTFGFIPGHPSAYTQPLYGWFLIPIYWLFGRNWLAVGLAQTLVAVATSVVVWRIGRRWLSPRAGVIAAVLVGLHPYLVWHDMHLNREILDHLLAALTVYGTLRAAERYTWRPAVVLGAVLGLAVLGNVRLEGLVVLLAAGLLWKAGLSRGTMLATGALLGSAVLVVVPWVVRTKVEVGCWTVSTDARALWKANNVNTLSTLRHGGWIDHVPQPRSFPPTPQDVFERWQRTGIVTPYDECAQMHDFQRRVLGFWWNHPGEKARLLALDATWLWQPSVVETRGRPGAGGILDDLRSTAEPVYTAILYLLGAVGLLLVARRFAVLALTVLAYQTAVAMLFVGETRYRVPWDFTIALLAAATVVEVFRRYRAKQPVPVLPDDVVSAQLPG